MKVNNTKVRNAQIIGNQVFSNSGELVAEVFLKNYRLLKLHFIMRDNPDEYCIAEFFKKGENIKGKLLKPRNQIYVTDGLYVCQYCNRPIMRIYDDKLINSAVYIICGCGEIYDFKYVI